MKITKNREREKVNKKIRIEESNHADPKETLHFLMTRELKHELDTVIS